MTRRSSVKMMAGGAAALAATGLRADARPSKKQPNILLLFSDQHQAACLGFQGHPDVITPHLDALAGGGMAFNRAYCQDGVCVPSRMSLITGLYPRRLGILHNPDKSPIGDEVVSLQTILQSNGYTTAAFGKRHLKQVADLGWDIHRGHAAKESPGASYADWIEEQGYADEFQRDRGAEHGGKYPIADLATRISALPEDKTMEAFTAQRTVEFIRDRKNRDKPFFCWSSFYRPHQPYNALQRYLDMYDYSTWGEGTAKGSAIKKPPTLNEAKAALPPALQSWRNGRNKVWRLDRALDDEQLFRFYIASYYALVTEIDHHIGTIMEALKEEGLLDNTIVVYTSDHGDFVGRHGMVEKCAVGHNVYEETLRVPLIVSHRGVVKPNQTCDDLTEMFGLHPTLLDLVGASRPPTKHGVDATSFAPLLTTGKGEKREYIVSENWSQAAVITDTHKLGLWLDPKGHPKAKDYSAFGDMLFDRQKDPDETTNLIDDPDYAGVVKELRKRYQEFAARVSS